MNQHFWDGFEKQAVAAGALAGFGTKLMGWGQKALKGIGEFTGTSQLWQGGKRLNEMRRAGQLIKAPQGAKNTLFGRTAAQGQQRAFNAARQQVVEGGKNLGRIGTGAGLTYVGGKFLGGGQQPQAPVNQNFYGGGYQGGYQ